MHLSNKAAVFSLPSLLFAEGTQAWSAGSDYAPISAQVVPANTGRGRKMKILGNATALFVALSIMVGLLLAQRGYQNSWREPTALQTSPGAVADAGALESTGGYKVVMK